MHLDYSSSDPNTWKRRFIASLWPTAIFALVGFADIRFIANCLDDMTGLFIFPALFVEMIAILAITLAATLNIFKPGTHVRLCLSLSFAILVVTLIWTPLNRRATEARMAANIFVMEFGGDVQKVKHLKILSSVECRGERNMIGFDVSGEYLNELLIKRGFVLLPVAELSDANDPFRDGTFLRISNNDELYRVVVGQDIFTVRINREHTTVRARWQRFLKTPSGLADGNHP